jgi:hypothetical protein
MDAIARRPILLSIVTILMILSGAFAVISGVILAVFSGNDSLQRDSGESSSTLLTLGITGIILGLIHIWLAMGLRRGSRFIRGLVGIYEIVQIAAALWALIALHAQYRVNAIMTILISLFVLWYLFVHQQSRVFFAR